MDGEPLLSGFSSGQAGCCRPDDGCVFAALGCGRSVGGRLPRLEIVAENAGVSCRQLCLRV